MATQWKTPGNVKLLLPPRQSRGISHTGLARCLEIMGEAASKITDETRVGFPRIPFVKMISMRNRLIHAYFDLNLDIVWTTVNDDLPAVISTLDSALHGEDQPGVPDR